MLEHSLSQLVDIRELQPMADALYEASAIPTVIVDHQGGLLVCSGGSRTCDSFHRAHPEAGATCVRNAGIVAPELTRWRTDAPGADDAIHAACPNGFRYIGLPIVIERSHVATLVICSFLFDDDPVDADKVRAQARRYGFQEDAYLESFHDAPRLSRARLGSILNFHRHFVGLISRQGLANLKLRKEMEARKRASLRLEDQRRYIDALSSALPTPVFFKDTGGVYRNCNDAFAQLLGRPMESIIGQVDRDVLTPEFAPDYQEQDAKLYARGGVQSYQSRLRDAGGIEHEVLISKTVYSDANGTPQGIIGAVTDITELRAVEKKAREHETLYHLFADNAGDVISIVGADLRHRYVSPSIERFLGYSQDEVLELDLEALYPPESLERLKATLQPDHPVEPSDTAHDEARRSEYVQIRKDGSTIWTEVIATPLREDSGEIDAWLCVARDITDRKDFESQLVSAKNMAEAADRAKSEFLANMSHEIRTPLNGIFGMLQLLAANTGLDEEQTQYVNVALGCGKSLVTIIEDILEFSRFDTGAATIDIAPFSPAEAVETVIDNFKIEAKRRQLTLVCDIGPEVPHVIMGDVGRLRQVLFHLVGNALKFTPQGEVRVEVRRLQGTGRGLARLRYVVSDTGIGIPEDKLSDIFQPFSQVDGSYTRRYQGTGIGLGLVKRIVDRLGGEVEIESAVDQGTAIMFTLEAPARDAEPVHIEQPFEEDACETTGQRRILVTEDDSMNQLTAQRFLEKLGYEPTIVSTGEEALGILREQDFDLVIMDVQMPGMDGIQTTQAIREDASLGERRAIPIVAMTAHAMGEDRERFLAAGMDDYISKPVDMGELRDVLCKQLMSSERA